MSPVREQVLIASRRTIAWHAFGAGILLLLCLAILAIGLALSLAAPDVRGVGRRSAGIFGLAAVGALLSAAALAASVVRLVRPYRLTIGADALVVQKSFGGPLRIRWEGVQEFVASGDSTSPAIAIRYDRANALTGLAMGGSFGTQEALPVGEFDMSAYAIAQLLNEALREGVGPAPVTTPAPTEPPTPPPADLVS